MREEHYNDYLCGRYSISTIEQQYADIQYFLESCSSDIWQTLEDFADVSYTRRLRLAEVYEKLHDVEDVRKVFEEVLRDFQEQEAIVRAIADSLGFDEAFIDTTKVIVTSHKQQQPPPPFSATALPSTSSKLKHHSTATKSLAASSFQQATQPQSYADEPDDDPLGFLPLHSADV